MLAKLPSCVNGKCVLLCTLDEKPWSNVAHSASFRPDQGRHLFCKSLIVQGLNKVGMLPRKCRVVLGKVSTKTGVPMGIRETASHPNLAMSPSYDERRRFQRISLQVPLFIRGKDAYGEQFLELAKTLDISGIGAFLTSPRPLAINEIVTLTIPAPSITSSALVPAGMPPIQARVKRKQDAGDVQLVGVEFLKPIG
jgi:hypothetical protein